MIKLLRNKSIILLCFCILYIYESNIYAQPSPCEIYLKNNSGIVSKTVIREYTDNMTGELVKQAQFWCYDGYVHYFIYAGFNNGWYVYNGFEFVSIFSKEYNNEVLFVNSNCNTVVLRQGNNEKRFDIASNRNAYLEYNQKVQSLMNGTFSNPLNGGTRRESTVPQKDYNRCRTCNGSGVCTSCRGRGGEWRDTGYYTGSNVKSWISCGSCSGNGRCFNCHGSGRY